MNVSKPSMRCRNHHSDVETKVRVDLRDKLKRKPVYCLSGVRHGGGMNLILAYVWNVGTRRPDAKEETQVDTTQESEYRCRRRGRNSLVVVMKLL